MINRYLILTAHVVSVVLSPFYLPLLAFALLIFFSYLRFVPISYSAHILLLVFLFTILVPRLAIYIYRKVNGWTRHELGRRERRVVPYILSIASYATLLYLMTRLLMPRFMMGVIAGSLAIQVVCAVLTPWIKVSTHAAAAGGVIGAIMAFSVRLNFNPIAGLCYAILLAGVVCTARLILRQHTLSELLLGTLIGMVSAIVFIGII